MMSQTTLFFFSPFLATIYGTVDFLLFFIIIYKGIFACPVFVIFAAVAIFTATFAQFFFLLVAPHLLPACWMGQYFAVRVIEHVDNREKNSEGPLVLSTREGKFIFWLGFFFSLHLI